MNLDYLAAQAAQLVLATGANKLDRDYKPDATNKLGDKVGLKRPGISVTAELDNYVQAFIFIPDHKMGLNDGDLLKEFFEPAAEKIAAELAAGMTTTSVLMVRPFLLPPAGLGVRSDWGDSKDFGLGMVTQYSIDQGGYVIRLGVLCGYAETRKAV